MVESRQEEVLAIIGVFAVLAFVFVVVRVYSRYLGRNFGWDDYLIIAAIIFLFGQTLTIWKCTSTVTIHILTGVKRSSRLSSYTPQRHWLSCLGLTQEASARASRCKSLELCGTDALSSTYVSH